MSPEIPLVLWFQSFLKESVFLQTSAFFLARWLIVLCAALFVGSCVLVYRRPSENHAARELVWMLLLTTVISLAVSSLVGRERPFMQSELVWRLVPAPLSTHSFPSTHSALIAAWAYGSRWMRVFPAWFLWLCAGGVGLGRVLVGVHFPSDVLAGMLLGVGVGMLVRKGHHLLRSYAT